MKCAATASRTLILRNFRHSMKDFARSLCSLAHTNTHLLYTYTINDVIFGKNESKYQTDTKG